VKTAGRWLLAAPVLVAVAAIAVGAFSSGKANIVTREAAREIASWAATAGPRQDTMAAVLDDLRTATVALPGDAHGVELQGIVKGRGRADPAMLAEAIADFRQAVMYRPVSPYTWANLVHAFYEAGNTGPEFEHAIRQAQALGPWEPEVQATLANYGLAVREEVSPATRGAIDLAVASAMRRNPSETLQISERRGRLDVACAGVNWDPAAKPYKQCQQWEKRP
jgi:hypothetical protein